MRLHRHAEPARGLAVDLDERAQAAVLGLRGDLAQHGRRCAASRPAGAVHSETSSVLLPISVYWNCARLVRVLIWMSCTGWKYTVMPGTPPMPRCSRSTISVTLDLRSSRGFRVIFRCPVLGVGLSALTPTTETTPSTSGSLRMASATLFCSRCHLGERHLGCGLHHRGDEAGVLQRQEPLRHDQIEADGDDQRGERHEQRRALVPQHPDEAPVIAAHDEVEDAVEEARDEPPPALGPGGAAGASTSSA